MAGALALRKSMRRVQLSPGNPDAGLVAPPKLSALRAGRWTTRARRLADELGQTAPGLSSRLVLTSTDLVDAFPAGREDVLPESLSPWVGEVAKDARLRGLLSRRACAVRGALPRFA